MGREKQEWAGLSILPPTFVLEAPSDSSMTSGSDSLEQRKGGKAPKS